MESEQIPSWLDDMLFDAKYEHPVEEHEQFTAHNVTHYADRFIYRI